MVAEAHDGGYEAHRSVGHSKVKRGEEDGVQLRTGSHSPSRVAATTPRPASPLHCIAASLSTDEASRQAKKARRVASSGNVWSKAVQEQRSR